MAHGDRNGNRRGRGNIVPIAALREDQLAAGARLMARAFHADPLFRYAWPDDDERTGVLPNVFWWNVKHGYAFGQIVATSGPLAGLAIVFPPSETAIFAASRLAHSGYDPMRKAVRASAWDRLQASFDVADRALQAAVQEPYWYLDALAVDPPHQRAGLGSALLAEVHARADRDGAPTVLLTFQPRNVPFYTRNGYAVIVSGTDEASGLSWWGFRRPPCVEPPTASRALTTPRSQTP